MELKERCFRSAILLIVVGVFRALQRFTRLRRFAVLPLAVRVGVPAQFQVGPIVDEGATGGGEGWLDLIGVHLIRTHGVKDHSPTKGRTTFGCRRNT